MYSRKVCDARLQKAATKLGRSLHRYSLEDCESAVTHLNELYDPDAGKLTRPLRVDELRWIKNERVVSRLDFRYWVERYAWVRHEDGHRIVPSRPLSVAQNILVDIWAELEEQGVAIALQNLKARQLRVSTTTELAVAHRVQFYRDVNAIVGSSDPDKSRKMAGMMELVWERTPWWLLPVMTSYRAGELMEFGNQNSGVSIQHGSQFTGIGRGTTPGVAHLSEVAEFIDPEELIDASLLNAMHESPWMFIVLESTAKEMRNWWHDKWEYNKANWSRGRSRLRPVFLPWFLGTDIYPTKTWLIAHPIPQDWLPDTLTFKHADRAQAYVKTSDVLSKYLGIDWKMPREQMWWWEVTKEEYKAQGMLNKFFQEMPADDLEAFQSSNVSAFDVETIQLYHESTEVPMATFGFVGRTIPEKAWPDAREIDSELPRMPIKSRLSDGSGFECELVPLKFRGYSGGDGNFTNRLFVWEFPDDKSEYGLGVDTGDGIGLDRTIMEVLRKGSHDKNDKQVAEFASAYINSYDLPGLAYAVLKLYSPVRECKAVIECNRNGESTQLELRKMGWTNFHRWMRYDSKKLHQSVNKLGWFTNAWSRPMMMDFLLKALGQGWIDIPSPFFVGEMRDLERDEYRQSLKAIHGGHDDRIMALGIVLFSLYVLELRGTQRGLLSERESREQEAVPMYSMGYQASSAKAEKWMQRFEVRLPRM